MKTIHLFLAPVLLASLSTVASSAPIPYSYEVIDLSSLLGTGSSSAVDINNNGQVIGQGPGGAFIYDPTSLAPVTYLSDTAAVVNAINDNGQVVGAGSAGAFLYYNGTVTSLGSDTVSANSINNYGVIAGNGYFVVNSSNQKANRGFVYNNGSLAVLGTLTQSSDTDPTFTSKAISVNNNGQVAGEASHASYNTKNAFLSQGGPLMNLGTLGGATSTAKSINDSGQIVGMAATASSGTHPFLYDSGAMTDLSTIIFNGCMATNANDINNNGQVVGNAAGLSGGSTCYLYDGSMTDLNLVTNTLGYQSISANAINDLGEIAVTGKYTASPYYTRALILVPATRTWDGGSTTDSKWVTATNWNPDTMPVKGSALVFTGVNRQANTNNSSLTNVGLVTFNNGGFNISGNALTLNAGIVSTDSNTWGINSTLYLAQSFTSLSGTLTVGGNVNNSGNLLTLDGPGDHLISGAISGTGGLTKSGSGTSTLSSTSNSYQGPTIVTAGVLQITGGVNSGSTPFIDVQGGMLVLKTTNVNNNALNIETAPGATFEVADGVHTLGNIDGAGTTEVNGQLTVTSMCQNTITLDPGAILAIAALPGGPTSKPAQLTAVPEPATMILIISSLFYLLIYRRRMGK